MLKSFISSLVAKHMSKKLIGMTISEEDINPLLKEIRISLLDADVSLIVVKDLLKNIRAKTIGESIVSGMDPQQFVLNVIKEELRQILGNNKAELKTKNKPVKIMLVGLQGSGKTTTAGKLAIYAKNKLNANPLLVALDIYRPAAIDQLHTLANQTQSGFYEQGNQKPEKTASGALEVAKKHNHDFIIFDTAGRLQTNEELMDELVHIKKTVNPDEILLVVDSMAGQDMINVASEFNNKLNLTGFIITKLDSDARGGVALSLTHLLNVPVKLMGTGEKLTALDVFYPERMADRIMGLGDIMTLAEKAQDVIDENFAKKSFTKMLSGKMDLEDLLMQMKQIQKLGSLSGVVKMLPGANKLMDQDVEAAEERIRVWTILMNSMTLEERRNPRLLKIHPTRKARIIKGSGRKPDEFNKLLSTWEQFKKQMETVGQELKKGKNPFMRLFNK